MSKFVDINTKEIDRILNNLSEKNRSDAIFLGLKKGGEEMVEKTRSIIVRKMGEGASSKNKYKKKSVKEGYHIAAEDKDKNEVLVTATGFFLTWIFELGTMIRKLKRTGAKDRSRGKMGDRRYWKRKVGKETFYKAGSNRGRINPNYAFKEAKQSSMEEVSNTIIKTVEKELNKIMK